MSYKEEDKVELYNTSKYVRRIPKYRYNGSYILQPGDSVIIDRDKASFFKPYSSIGVVVRSKVDLEELKGEKDIISQEKIEKTKEIKKDVEETKDTIEKVVTDTGKEENVVEGTLKDDIGKDRIDLSKLDSMGLNQLKDMAKSLGIEEASSMRKKADIRDLIRKFYE